MVTVLFHVAYAAFGIIAFLMVAAILLQEGRGGGLSALGGTQAESAFGASNPIRRATVVLAILFFVLAGVLSYVRSGRRIHFDDQPSSGETSAAEKASPAEAPAPEKAAAAPPESPAESESGSAPKAAPAEEPKKPAATSAVKDAPGTERASTSPAAEPAKKQD